MQQAQDRLPILIVGASGQVGCTIAFHCLKRPELLVNILLPDPHSCTNVCDEVKNRGGKCIVGDLTKPQTIKGCCKGIHTVISCVGGDEKVLLDGQEVLLQDAIQNGVKRFIPSEFTFDVRKIKEEDHPAIASKIRFRRKLTESPIKGLFVHCGVLYESFFNKFAHGIFYWETMDQKFALTSVEDVGKVVAAAVAKPDRVGDLVIAGDQLSLREIMELYNDIRDVKIPCNKMGNLADLYKVIGSTKTHGEAFKSRQLNYHIFIVDGRGTLEDLNNQEFPEVKFTHFDQFIVDHPDLKLGDHISPQQEKQAAQYFIPGMEKALQSSH